MSRRVFLFNSNLSKSADAYRLIFTTFCHNLRTPALSLLANMASETGGSSAGHDAELDDLLDSKTLNSCLEFTDMILTCVHFVFHFLSALLVRG